MRFPQRAVLLAIVVGLGQGFVTACGDDNPQLQDGSMPPMDGSGSGVDTFTKFVIDLIETPPATPAAFSTFSTLPDPDALDNNGSAYSSLF
jgi:hypothetical protein